ncbi:MAG: ORF6N domain-containing protein, partial [Candidatus Pacebacteria bacterium]|nr:ORF6N domain-containing protein [Candidatus Paceibacterota bacterium]
NVAIFSRLETIEQKQIGYDKKLQQLFNALDDKSIKPKQGIFYDGQIFDAYVFVSKLIRTAKKSIILIDNFIDENVLVLLAKKRKGVRVIIYTKNLSKVLKLDLNKYNKQYGNIDIKVFDKAYDRFLILDNSVVYHFGASLKDLGKKWFAFSKFDKQALKILNKLNK